MSLQTPPLQDLGVWKQKSGIRVGYSRKLRRITLQRLLVTKLVYFKEEVTYKEVLVLYDNQVWCLEKNLKDQSFHRKFNSSLEELSKILTEIKFNENSIPSAISRLSLELRSLEGFLFPKRNFRGTWKYVVGKFEILSCKPTGIPSKCIPPKPYIGVGYKDKGNYRNQALDGSPGWKTVAMSRHVENNEEWKTFSQK
jgi:hypothetical protein